MFANFIGLSRQSDLIAVLSAMLIVLALIARAPLPETGAGLPLANAISCAAQTVCPLHGGEA